MNAKRTLLNTAALVVLCSTIGAAHAVPISGAYVGTFINPVPGSPPAVTTGLGTNNVTWGIPCDGFTNCGTSPGGITPPSSFRFTPTPFTTEIGEPFVLGEIRFFNGTISGGTQLDQVTLFLDGFQITPTEYAGPDYRVITIVNTPNIGDPISNADRAFIPDAFFPAANVFGVLESQSAIATVLGEFKVTSPGVLGLDILGFGSLKSGSGFVEGFPPAQAPEPTALALLGVGLAGLGFVGRRRKT